MTLLRLVSPPARAETGSNRWLSTGQLLLGSVALGVLMSTQYFFQLFIWRHWPLDEVMSGWLEIARDRLVVSLMIGAALVAATHIWKSRPYATSAVLAMAILVGATAGEITLLWAGFPGSYTDAAAVAGRVARWSVLAGSVAIMSYMWRRSESVGSQVRAIQLRQAQIERQVAAARLATLRVQIEPHFLFNTLATVRRLHQTQPAQGAQLLEHFIEYLRSAQSDSASGTVATEIGLVRAYLGVAVARMSGRLQVTFEVAEELMHVPFPALALATLVENAVNHGIAPLPSGGTIHVSVSSSHGWLHASVTDTGAGFSGSSGSGIGLANIRARLSTLYGSAGTLSLRANPPRGVRAEICIPLEMPEKMS